MYAVWKVALYPDPALAGPTPTLGLAATNNATGLHEISLNLLDKGIGERALKSQL